jgi:hypothetical protein
MLFVQKQVCATHNNCIIRIYPKVLRGIGHHDWPKRAITMPLCCLDFRDLTEISSRIPSCCVG